MKTNKVALALIILGVVLWFPLTRGLLLFILPLGSGFDDLIFIVSLGGGLSILALKRASSLSGQAKTKAIFGVVAVSILAIAGIILSML